MGLLSVRQSPPEGRQSPRKALNRRFLEYVLELLEESEMTGSVTLHANQGGIRKIERSDFHTEKDLTGDVLSG
jgi:hypothetical protein